MKQLEYKDKTKVGVCAAKFCTHKTKGSYLCSSCRSKKARLKAPVRYAFNNLRVNAKRRGVLFTITLEQFRDWCKKSYVHWLLWPVERELFNRQEV